jgi:nitrous oxide reductase accessory protein NosL
MIKRLMLLILSALLIQACAETTTQSRKRNTIIDLADTCATCGASVSDNYFAGSAFKAIGPGNY